MTRAGVILTSITVPPPSTLATVAVGFPCIVVTPPATGAASGSRSRRMGRFTFTTDAA